MSEYRFFILHKMLVLSMNALVLGALFVSMYQASLYPEEFTLVFCKVFFSILAPLFVAGYACKRKLRNCMDVVS